MSLSYYDLLGLNMDAQYADIAKAFRTRAIKYHPDLNRDSGRPDCERKFRMVAEAFEVLSNPKLRAIFDQYGEDGLKEGGTGTVGVPGGYKFSGDADSVFKEFCGVARPFEDLLVAGPDEKKSSTDVITREQCAAKKVSVSVPLEDFFTGAQKSIEVTNTDLGKEGERARSTHQTTLSWKLEAGCPAGTRVRFERKGTTREGCIQGDVIVEVQQAPHKHFGRRGNDLVYCTEVALEDALCGFTVTVPTLDGRTLRLQIAEVVHPEYKKVVSGEGMPIPGRRGERGDLVLTFDVVFPPYLTGGQKMELARILGDDSSTAAP